MGNPSTMSDPFRRFNLLEVIIILLADVSHLLLEDTKLVLQVFELRYEDHLLGVPPMKNLCHLVGLETVDVICFSYVVIA